MLDILYNLIITPIVLVVEMTYSIMFRFLDNRGLAIIAVSLVIQTLILPLYKRSDALQEQERLKQEEMSGWVNHIKKTFKGDERFMMLSTYYRQQNYKTYYALKSSFSILLQIPFFMAAYNYLSNLQELKGTSFLFIDNLGAPDQMFTIMGFTINILPILMTLVNIISGIIYTKGFPLKSKLQVYGLALVFLVLLYNSPSGLVLYWLMNNLYSLFKNIFMKVLKHPKEVLSGSAFVCGIALLVYINRQGTINLKKTVFVLFLIVVSQIPMVIQLIKRVKDKKKVEETEKKESFISKLSAKKSIFFFEMIFLTVLMGGLIPLSVISSSATEFILDGLNPLTLVVRDLSIYAGIFIVWCSVFYFLMTEKAKKIFTMVTFAVSGVLLVNYMGFSNNFGVMNAYLVYENQPQYSKKDMLINMVVIAAVFAILLLIYAKAQKIAGRIVQIILLCAVVLCGLNINSTNEQMNNYTSSRENSIHHDSKILPLSKNGQNVVVFMLDRAISGYIPFIMEDYKEFKEDFSGFTYYPNTMSYGVCTNYAAPPLFGGYEYTPVEMNKRTEESLEAKTNEALSVLPVLFRDNNYKVTVCDPPYAGYEWVPDVSIYDEYEGIDAYVTQAVFEDEVDFFGAEVEANRSLQESNFVYYGIMKVMPVFMQGNFYYYGDYFTPSYVDLDSCVENNVESGMYSIGQAFFENYSVLLSLTDMTKIEDTDENNFLMMQNSTPHEAYLLSKPDYSPTTNIDVEAELANEPEHIVDGRKLTVDTEAQLAHYRTLIASLKQMAKWFNYMKENGVYDNTRIILVADHGYPLDCFEDWLYPDKIEFEKFNPLLMIKDFNATEFSVSNEFMTNADVPTYAVEDIIENPVNPFTGKEINNNEKTSHPQRITDSRNHDVKKNNGNVFDTSDMLWYEVHDYIFDINNWKVVQE